MSKDTNETLNDLNGVEKTSSSTHGGQETKIEYKVLENADLLFKKQYKFIMKMQDADIMTKKEILNFLQETYNTL